MSRGEATSAAAGPVTPTEFVPEAVRQLLEMAVPEADGVLAGMGAYAAETGFPTVGTDVGAFLRPCARTVGASSVFEFGSGIGDPAAWIAPALPAGGRVVLSEYDLARLDRAREYLAGAGATTEKPSRRVTHWRPSSATADPSPSS